MRMGRAPCCEKTGLKKGPWTPQEDRILISYIHQHGHPNWRALPKHAGLLRCGKSCRLRWVNYLKPDIKRGQFTPEEEESIIKFHAMLGNRWSAIAARLPGRTDNEIKNVWHTHLRKRLNTNNQTPQVKPKKTTKAAKSPNSTTKTSEESSQYFAVGSPQQSATTTETSTVTEGSCMYESFPEIDESFWTEALSAHNKDGSEMAMTKNDDPVGDAGALDEETDFWFSVFIQAGGTHELPEF